MAGIMILRSQPTRNLAAGGLAEPQPTIITKKSTDGTRKSQTKYHLARIFSTAGNSISPSTAGICADHARAITHPGPPTSAGIPI
jgi:hypothetical protein